MPVFGADCAEADSRVPPASAAANMATMQRFLMASLQLAVAMNPPIAGAAKLAHTVTFAAHAKLYEFAHFVRFSRKIAAIDNTTGDFSLFFSSISRCILLPARDDGRSRRERENVCRS